MTTTEIDDERFSETWAIDDEGNDVPGSGVRRVYAERCEDDGIHGRCIGVKGHEGLHWRYSEYGSYCSWVGDDVKLEDYDIASSMTPCGHPKYVPPTDREHEVHSRHDTFESISASSFDSEMSPEDRQKLAEELKRYRDTTDN